MEVIRTNVNMPNAEWITTAAYLFADSFDFVRVEKADDNSSCKCYVTDTIYIDFTRNENNTLKICVYDTARGTSREAYSNSPGETNITIYKYDNNTGMVTAGSWGNYSNMPILFLGNTTNLYTGGKSKGVMAQSSTSSTATHGDYYVATENTDIGTRLSTDYTMSYSGNDSQSITQLTQLVYASSGIQFDDFYAVLKSNKISDFVLLNDQKYLFAYGIAIPTGNDITYTYYTDGYTSV